MSEDSKQNENQGFMLDDNTFDDESKQLNELDFPWPLINIIKNVHKSAQSKSESNHQWVCPHGLQLVVFLICNACIVFGFISLNECSPSNMLSIFFIVQGVLGLVVILFYFCRIIFDWEPRRIARMYHDEQLVIRCLIAFSHLITIFLIIWFYIGHIWFIPEIFYTNQFSFSNQCHQPLHIFTIIMVIIQYIVSIWMIYSLIWSNSRFLYFFQKQIQHRLNQLSNNNKHFDEKTLTKWQEDDHKNIDDNERLVASCI